jgi:transcriptional regulator with XRE-family HTH domain
VTGRELKKRRALLGLTQKELAERLGVSPNTVARWERGERQVPVLLLPALELIEIRAGVRSEMLEVAPLGSNPNIPPLQRKKTKPR